jgi:hypothetical protein
MATYDIDLLRALMVDKLNDNSIFLASFYEQIQDEEQITRYVDSIKELIALQNSEKSKSGYKAMGIISQSGSADILNIKQNYIVPLEYDVRLDIEITDRDYVLGKIKQLIDDLRGRKFDVIQLVSGQVVVPVTPTIVTSNDKMVFTNNILIGQTATTTPNGETQKSELIADILNRFQVDIGTTYTFYQLNTLPGSTIELLRRTLLRSTVGDTTINILSDVTDLGDVISRNKISMSFNGIQSQEPYINNGVDRVFLFFGGSATIVDNNVTLGNDIITTTIQKGKNTGTIFTVEPTELTGSLDVSDDTFQTWANGYQSTDRNMAIANKVSYSFVFDRSNTFYEELYKYGRYGAGAGSPSVVGLAQIELTVKEYRYSFGVLTIDKFYAKLGSVNTQNTNGDVMTISILLKVGAY